VAHIENADLGVWNATAVAGLGVGLVPRLPAVADFMAEMHCAHVRSPGGVYLKCLCKPVYNCIYIYVCILDDFGCFGNVYVWFCLAHLRNNACWRSVFFLLLFFNVFGTCVLPRPFLSPPTGHLCRVQVSLYNARVEIGWIYGARMYCVTACVNLNICFWQAYF